MILTTLYFSHGTSVAGVIASEAGNNICTAGVAHNATIVGKCIL